MNEPGSAPAAAAAHHPCPKGDDCALNNGAIHCFACRRNWPRDETWEMSFAQRPIRDADERVTALGHEDAELNEPRSVSDRRLLDIVQECLSRWHAYPTIPGSLRWARNGTTALMEIERRLSECVVVTTESGERGEWWEDAWRRSVPEEAKANG